MTITEIKEIWPDWRIEFVCDCTCEKLRNIKGINFVYLRNEGWKEWGDGTNFYIPIIFENRLNNTFLKIELHQDLFCSEYVKYLDEKSSAVKMKAIRDKVILRLAWNLKEHFKGRN